MARLNQMQRAELWYARQVKQGNLRDADYSALTRRMTLCYEPAVMLNNRQNVTKHDILQKAKEMERVLKFKLGE